MRVACLLIPHFALGCERTDNPELGRGAKTLAIIEGRVVRDVTAQVVFGKLVDFAEFGFPKGTRRPSRCWIDNRTPAK